jgi:formate dehydrogenase subunit beta
MNKQWMLQTHGDPLGTLRKFAQEVWSAAGLNGMLVPIESAPEGSLKPHLLEDPAQLTQVNPFRPLMTLNAARLIPEILRAHPGERLAAMLRPCEMRALIEMQKHQPFPVENLLTISVDCLGTFPADEFQWRSERKGSQEGLTSEALQFARQGGIVPYRYRPACQLCTGPDAQNADLNIGVLGLPVRQAILVSARDSTVAERLGMQSICDGPADDVLVRQRERLLAKMVERSQHTRQRITSSLAGILPLNLDALVDQFNDCGSCQECMENCPICSVDFPQREAGGGFVRIDVMRWLVSCSGCGMCEQACPNHKPLCAIFGHIRQQLVDALGYQPGQSIHDPLPVA